MQSAGAPAYTVRPASEVASHLEEADISVDPMRDQYTTWTHSRLALRHVAETDRPGQGSPDPEHDPFARPGSSLWQTFDVVLNATYF
ncbi:MAG: hypothetical protein MJE77_24460 [Proteobacteria bacterium]|nr:hypothetical protein [Pseudomonadota bacterium]